jgi:hypothetical protein
LSLSSLIGILGIARSGEVATVDGKRCASDKARLWTGEIGDETRDFGALTQAADRHQGAHHGALGLVSNHIGLGRTRLNRIDRDPARPEIAHKAASQALFTALRARIMRARVRR